MTKEQFKDYILEAVEAMGDAELEYLFPASNQPDLFTIVSELTGLRGEVKKLAGAALRTNNELHAFLEQQQAAAESPADDDRPDPQILAAEILALKEEVKMLLLQVLEQDDNIGQAFRQLEELPPPGLFSLGAFKSQLASWQKGFGITVSKWQAYVKSLGLYKTGLPGEPFNPQCHEAVDVRFHPDLPANAVLETEVAGFLYKQQVLRLARVVVNKHPPDPKPVAEATALPVEPTPDLPPATPAPPAPEIVLAEVKASKKHKEKSKRKKRKKHKK